MRNLLGGNWGLKAISLAFAVLLWFFVVGEEKAEITLSVPLEIVNVPERMVVANDPPPFIKVRAYGPSNLLRGLSLHGLSKVIDLKGAKTGEMIIHLSPESLALPSGVKVMRIQPATIRLVLDWALEKEVPVEAVLVGSVAPYYELGGWKVTPPVVRVVGPAREVKELKSLKTLPIDLKSASKDFAVSTALDLEGLHITLPDEMGLVRVAIHVVPIQGERRVSHVPVRYDRSRVARIWPPVVTCRVKGPLYRLKRLRPGQISVSLDLSAITANATARGPTLRLPLKVEVPKGLTAVEVVPSRVKVHLRGVAPSPAAPSGTGKNGASSRPAKRKRPKEVKGP